MKTMVEKYVVCNPEGRWLANIVLDDVAGDIYIQSDYGDYSYWWSHRGVGVALKEFLRSSNLSYIQDKFGYGGKNEYFYFDKTCKNIQADIIKKRRMHIIDKSNARRFYQEIQDLDSDCTTTSEAFTNMTLFAPETLATIYGNDPFLIPWVVDTHPHLVAFMVEVWPHFMSLLDKETNSPP